MMEENKEEIKENEEESAVEETDTKTEEQLKEDKKKAERTKGLALVLAGVVVIAMMGIRSLRNGSTGTTACEVVPQAAWGQSQPQVWVDTQTIPESKAVTGFDITLPETPEDYPNISFRAYTKQILEARYTNDEGVEGLRIDKAILCGEDIFTGVYQDNTDYSSITKVMIGDIQVTERGDGETISTASWVNGEYSYAVSAWNDPLSAEEVEEMVKAIE